jgi:hypothetical protein
MKSFRSILSPVSAFVVLAVVMAGCEFPTAAEKPAPTQSQATTQQDKPSTIEVRGLNFLVQAKGAAWPRWLDGTSHAVASEALPYGGRGALTGFNGKPAPFSGKLEASLGSRTLVNDRVDFNQPGAHSVFLLGSNTSEAQSGSGMGPTLLESPFLAGKQEGIQFLHAVPEHHLVDLYLNRKLAAESLDFKSIVDLPAVAPLTEITIVVRGKAPSFDPAQDELHLRLEKPIEDSSLLLVYAFKAGQTQGFGNDTVFIYKSAP